MKLYTVDKASAEFYPVSNDEIKDLENVLNITIPNELKKFYTQFGYGFLGSKDGYPNRIMDTYSIRDFRLQQNDYEFFEDIDLYKKYEDGKLVFFEQDESAMLSIELGDKAESKIYYYDTVVANSLQEFLQKMEDDELYFTKL
ncbi:SUKH superfamily protein [Breznakia blatticola]|uniref:SUKH superfamily protein n=1 Tax=Breznakia blatticola TaxID=1754012 RepID=A0A4R7ZA07_9FIRM|nr:SMI1/KNR4 family protein [Breznakia blatticola]TDW08232.1 SUKH superfamily protein [Breznakia blatticola]